MLNNRASRVAPGCMLVFFTLGLLFVSASVRAENHVLTLDGKGSYVELPPNIFKDLTQATVEAWVKWDNFNAYSRVFEFGAPWQSMSLFNHQTNADLRFNLYPRNSKTDTSAMHIVRAPNILRTNEWIHIAAVSGGRIGMKLYVNGVLVGSNATTACFASIDKDQTNLIGRGMSGNLTDQDFRGEIDELRVWSHRRSTGQIRENMYTQLTGAEKGIVGLWNFENGNATDATKRSNHGKMIGRAKVVKAKVGLAADLAAFEAASKPVAAAVAPTTNVVIVTTTPAPTVPAPAQAGSNLVAWCIAGALIVLAGLVACLLLMLRRSGVGKPELLTGKMAVPLLGGEKPEETAADHAVMKERALAELTEFAKESLVQGLYSQRTALLEAQKQAQKELADLEVRLANLQLPERIRAYEGRIAELESELQTRGEELREVTQATLLVFRRKLAEEKQTEAAAHRN